MARVSGIISAGLASAQDFTKAQNSSADLVRDNIAARASRQTETDTAGLPPDWLPSAAAGAGFGWLFGPAGGLIGAGIAGVLSKRRREGIAAYASQDALSTEATIAAGYGALDSAAERAEGDESQLAEITMIREEAQKWEQLTQSPDPQLRATALIKFGETTGTLDTELEELETRRIAEQERELDQFNTEATRAAGIRDDLFGESAEYRVREDAYKRMLAIEDSSWGDQVMMVNAFKMIDPNSAVMPGEAATAANASGIPSFLVTAYNNLARDGGRLGPEQRSDIMRQSGLQYGEARADQVDRNTDAVQRARDNGVRNQMLPQISVPVPTSDELPFPRKRGELDAVDEAAIRDLRIVRDDAGQWRVQDPDGTYVLDLEVPQDVGDAETVLQSVKDVLDVGPDEDQPFSDENKPSILDFSDKANEYRRIQNEERMRRNPGLFQPGGAFGGEARPVND